MRTLSRTIPINSRTWGGPRVLEATTGTLTDMKVRSKVLKLVRHCNLEGSTRKKSSSIWMTCLIPYLFLRIHPGHQTIG